MIANQAIEEVTVSDSRSNLPNGCFVQSTNLTRTTIEIKYMFIENRVKGVMKTDEKERNYKKILQEASKIVENLKTTGKIDRVITHDNNLKNDEFDTVHEWASAVRHTEVKTHINSSDV